MKILKKHLIFYISLDISYLHVFTYSERDNTTGIGHETCCTRYMYDMKEINNCVT